MSSLLNILVISPSNLGPYHLRRYNCLARADCTVTVACCPLKEHQRPWVFERGDAAFSVEYPFADCESLGRIAIFARARSYLDEVKPDAVIVVGYGSRFMRIFAAAARARKIPTILRLAGVIDFSQIRLSREIAKQIVCRTLFDGVIVPGVLSAKYASILGFSAQQIARVGNVIDNSHFANTTPISARKNREFIYIGRLSPEKNLVKLIDAFKRYRAEGGDWALKIVGDGPERDELEEHAGGDSNIEFYGWASYEEIPELLNEASVFVLPSIYEPWGLVVNEAMAAGLGVLVSRNCGCYPELCREGTNGFNFDPNDMEDLVQNMLNISSLSVEELDEMGRMSRAIISSYTLDSWARALRNFVQNKVSHN